MRFHGRRRRAGAAMVLVALAAGMLAAASAPSGGADGAGGLQAAPAGTAPPATRKAATRAADLPESVLAEIGGTRRITAGTFRRGWTQVTPPARPDSLTPESARQFLDLLIAKEVLAAHAIEESWEWTPIESAQVANLQDRTMMRLALDRTLAEHARARAVRGDSALPTEALGVLARESTVTRLEVSYDGLLLSRLAKVWASLPRPSADSSIWSRLRVMGQMPAVDPADSARVVAWSGAGTVKVADLLEAWKKLNPLLRPRVEGPDQVRDLVKNTLFERVLRRQAEAERLDRDPGVTQVVQRQREFLASQYFVNREVYGKIPDDDATLRRYYDRDPGVWSIPTRVQVVRLLLPERGEAAQMALRLRDPAEADSLVARGARQRVEYASEISAASDSALFAAVLASGTGTVLGPDSVAGGWQVVRVNAVLPARGRAFEEVKDLVLRAWSDEEAERRMGELLATLRKRTRVQVSERGLAALVKAGLPAPRGASGRAP